MGNCGGTQASSEPADFGTKEARDFEVLSEIGVGSFGSVTCCKWLESNELFAVKKIKKARLFRRTDHSALVWNERDAMIKCDSDFCVGLKCAYQTDEDLFLVMPFFHGGDLLHHIKSNGCLTPKELQFYLGEMILGLESMHLQNVCHRDIKPENILIDAEGHLAITDFGLAVEIDPHDDECPNRHWGQCGSYGFRSLEVISDGVCGFYSDIYAMGILAYYLIFGKVPWAQTKLVFKGVPLVFPYLPRTEARIPSALKKLIISMLQFDYRKRITIEKIKFHEFFSDFDWKACASRQLAPPFVPKTDHEYARKAPAGGGPPVSAVELSDSDQEKFAGFDWVPGDPIKLFESPASRKASLQGSPLLERSKIQTPGTPEYIRRALSSKPTDNNSSPHASPGVPARKLSLSHVVVDQRRKKSSDVTELFKGSGEFTKSEGNSSSNNDVAVQSHLVRLAAGSATEEKADKEAAQEPVDKVKRQQLLLPPRVETEKHLNDCWALSPNVPQRRMAHRRLAAATKQKP